MDVNGNLLEYRHLLKRMECRKIWGKAYGNELRRLAHIIGDNIKGTDTVFLTTKQNIPFKRLRDITYGQIVRANLLNSLPKKLSQPKSKEITAIRMKKKHQHILPDQEKACDPSRRS